MNIPERCCYCNRAEGECGAELRPYGPGGAWLCFDCMTASPDREAEAARQFHAQVDAAGQGSDVVVIGEQTGPRPLDPRRPQ